MRTASFFLLLSLGLCLAGASALAEDAVRYEPVLVQNGVAGVSDPKVLIVDTQEGHLWLWEQNNERSTSDTEVSVSRLTYQGTVGPGPRVGLPENSGAAGKKQ